MTADRSLVLERVIAAPVSVVWAAWLNPETLPLWWGPDGFTCRTTRIDLREGGDWVFDMIGPDGKVWPNHQRFTRIEPLRRIDYTLHAGENGPKHAEAQVTFADRDGATGLRLSMTFATVAEAEGARRFGAVDLGMQTLGKLAAFVGSA